MRRKKKKKKKKKNKKCPKSQLDDWYNNKIIDTRSGDSAKVKDA